MAKKQGKIKSIPVKEATEGMQVIYNIPTAEEFASSYPKAKDIYSFIDECEIVNEMLVEFAKLHVKAALQAASETHINHPYCQLDEESILNAYPESNIK